MRGPTAIPPGSVISETQTGSCVSHENPEDRIAETTYGAVISHWEPDGVGAYLRWGSPLLPGRPLQARVTDIVKRRARERRRAEAASETVRA